jgi:hypothetical protein
MAMFLAAQGVVNGAFLPDLGRNKFKHVPRYDDRRRLGHGQSTYIPTFFAVELPGHHLS